jgi:hypothetical protein
MRAEENALFIRTFEDCSGRNWTLLEHEITGLLIKYISNNETILQLNRGNAHRCIVLNFAIYAKIPDRNIVETIVNGETVYTSNIQNFQFGRNW